ncbi:ARM repeat-containing protein, partial [Ceratobasidium sp. AG-I]
NRFAGTRLEDLVGEIPALCKDQHGCRYLQKKLEEGVPEHRDIIFHETFSLFAELMTDPFGNYLCQKLLEYSTDEQRNMICESVAHDLVGISLNMHGTRAVQKMIDFLSTQRQIHSIIMALSMHVVTLIKDLNGNHVVQKCLNRLIPEDNQFIYNAVAAHCVEVATHRHGCCVLQRCIDHASDSQRIQLVTEITFNALTLVQDPYGNYVVQYILDLNDNRFSDAVIRQFVGNVCALSVQKFSSNVIEKCIRVAEHNTRKMLIEELLNRSRLEKLLRDSFGNYCVQTALDYAEPTQRMLLVEGIRPILPLIRNTPYGKRIQSKLQREQMESHHQQYGGGHNFNQAHAALVNLAMNGNGMPMGGRHVSQPSVHHSPLTDAYNRPNLYNMPQQMHPGLQQQQMDHYGTPHMMPSNLHHSPMAATTAFPNVSNFNSPMANNYGALGISAGMSDPYQRANFPYGM